MAKNNDDKKSINSYGSRQTYGVGANGEKFALSKRQWDDSFILTLHPELPTSKQVNGKMFDYDAGTALYIKPRVALGISNLMMRAVKEMDENGSVKKKRSMRSGANLIEVNDGGMLGTEKGFITLTLYIDLDEQKHPKEVVVFQFTPEIVINDFMPNQTGADYEVTSMPLDVEFLALELREFAKAQTNAVAHSIKMGLDYSITKITQRQIAVAEKLGIAEAYRSPSRPQSSWTNGNNSGGGGSSESISSDAINDAIASIMN